MLVCRGLQPDGRRPQRVVGGEARGDHQRVRGHQRLPVSKRQLQALTLMVRCAGAIAERQQRLGDVAVGAHLQCLEAQSLPRRQFELARRGSTGVVATGGSGDPKRFHIRP